MQQSGGLLLAASSMAATPLFSFPSGNENANESVLPLANPPISAILKAEVTVMLENTSWHKASQIEIHTTPNITGGFDIGFDREIPESTKAEMRAFVSWVEAHFNLPVTLWVDFEYKHYLLDRNKKQAGYLFYWADFASYPVFECEEDIPIIRLPVRTEYSTIEEILASFIEAISCYYAWIANILPDDFTCNESEVENILQVYLSFHSHKDIH